MVSYQLSHVGSNGKTALSTGSRISRWFGSRPATAGAIARILSTWLDLYARAV